MTSLLSDITKRAEGLAKGEPTMDSHESLYRAVLLAIQGGAANPQELIAAALKADNLSPADTAEGASGKAESSPCVNQGSDFSTFTEALDKIGMRYLVKTEDGVNFVFIAPRIPIYRNSLSKTVEDVSLEELMTDNKFFEFDEDGSISSY